MTFKEWETRALVLAYIASFLLVVFGDEVGRLAGAIPLALGSLALITAVIYRAFSLFRGVGSGAALDYLIDAIKRLWGLPVLVIWAVVVIFTNPSDIIGIPVAIGLAVAAGVQMLQSQEQR